MSDAHYYRSILKRLSHQTSKQDQRFPQTRRQQLQPGCNKHGSFTERRIRTILEQWYS